MIGAGRQTCRRRRRCCPLSWRVRNGGGSSSTRPARRQAGAAVMPKRTCRAAFRVVRYRHYRRPPLHRRLTGSGVTSAPLRRAAGDPPPPPLRCGPMPLRSSASTHAAHGTAGPSNACLFYPLRSPLGSHHRSFSPEAKQRRRFSNSDLTLRETGEALWGLQRHTAALQDRVQVRSPLLPPQPNVLSTPLHPDYSSLHCITRRSFSPTALPQMVANYAESQQLPVVSPMDDLLNMPYSSYGPQLPKVRRPNNPLQRCFLPATLCCLVP